MHACRTLHPLRRKLVSWHSVAILPHLAGFGLTDHHPAQSGIHSFAHSVPSCARNCTEPISQACVGKDPKFQGLDWGPPICSKPTIRAIRLAVWVASEGQGPAGAPTACTRQPQFLHWVISTSTFGPCFPQACMRVGCELGSTNHGLHTRKSC